VILTYHLIKVRVVGLVVVVAPIEDPTRVGTGEGRTCPMITTMNTPVPEDTTLTTLIHVIMGTIDPSGQVVIPPTPTDAVAVVGLLVVAAEAVAGLSEVVPHGIMDHVHHRMSQMVCHMNSVRMIPMDGSMHLVQVWGNATELRPGGMLRV
jgi:hypothetical protein